MPLAIVGLRVARANSGRSTARTPGALAWEWRYIMSRFVRAGTKLVSVLALGLTFAVAAGVEGAKACSGPNCNQPEKSGK